jgi:glycine/D-amino acid oxidase-like deaminating enzyme
MTDENVETPRVYRWDSKGMSMDEHPGYCQYVDKSDYEAKCAELERVKGEEEMVTRAYDAIFPYVPDAIPLDEKINELLKLYERAEQRATTAEAERDELKTRLHGEHDAHMDCHKKLEAAEAALARANACIRDFAVIAKLHDKADATITIRQGLKVWTGKHAAAIDAALSEAVPLSKERTDEIMNDLGFPSIRTNEKQ